MIAYMQDREAEPNLSTVRNGWWPVTSTSRPSRVRTRYVGCNSAVYPMGDRGGRTRASARKPATVGGAE